MSMVIPEDTKRKYESYPKYKGSGVEWLGEIPAHWEGKPLKRVLKVFNGSTPKSSEPEYWDGDIPWVTPEDLGELASVEISETKRYITQAGYESCGTNLVPTGSLVLSTRAPIGHLAIAAVALCTNQGCRALVPRSNIRSRFSYYVLYASRQELVSLGQGSTFMELGKPELETLIFPFPKTEEQQAIADFLDEETSRIDELIAKKQRLIELLHEQRTALITHTVTKGLNPDAPKKDSGVEWLGEIPAHWEIMRLKYAFVLQRGFDLASEDFINGSYPVCASNGIIGHHIEFTTKGPSVTVGRSGSVGEVNYYESDFWAHNTSLYVKQFLKATPRFVYYLLKVLNLESLSEGTAVGTLNRNYIHRLLIALPTTQEQQAIAEFLDKETSRIDILVSRINQAIEKLREYRSALITVAVTGKIDVREEIVRYE